MAIASYLRSLLVAGDPGVVTFFVCDTDAERPVAGLTAGDEAFALDTGQFYIAVNATTWLEIARLSALSSEISNRVSADNALSQAISVVSHAVSIEMSNRISADNALSQGISVVSQALSNETSNRVSADGVLSQAISSLSQSLSALEVRVSAISAAGGGGGSVTSDELSAAAAALSVRIDTVSDKASVLSHAVSVLSQGLSALSQANSAAHVSINNAISVVSAALASEISNRISAVSTVAQGLSLLSQSNSAAHVSINNAISVVSAALADETSNRISADNALSQGISVVSQALSVTNVNLSNLQSSHDALSNLVSNIISSGGGGVSVTSAELSAAAAALSVRIDTVSDGVSVLSQAVSVLSNQVSALSENLVSISQKVSALQVDVGSLRPLTRVLQTTGVHSGLGLTPISGFSASVVADGVYEVWGMIIDTVSVAAQTVRVGWSATAGAIRLAFGDYQGAASYVAPGGSTWLSTIRMAGQFNEVGIGSITYSVVQGASATTYGMRFRALFVASTDGAIQLQAGASTAQSVFLLPGSYMKVLRIQ